MSVSWELRIHLSDNATIDPMGLPMNGWLVTPSIVGGNLDTMPVSA
jgi:hypothetical protein